MTRRPTKRAAAPRGKAGGSRPNSGPDPVLGPGNVRSVIKTVRLSPAEEKTQISAAARAGAKDWGTWIRDLGNAAARAALLAAMQAEGVDRIAYEDDQQEATKRGT